MSTRSLLLPLLLSSGCFLFPTKDLPRVEEDLSMPDLLSDSDLRSEEDLGVPDLKPAQDQMVLPDLQGSCGSEPACAPAYAGQACKNGLCAPCAAHLDCESLVCDPYQTVQVGAAMVPGRCVAKAEVVYVNNQNGGACASGDGNTPATAKCLLSEGLALVDGVNKKSVRVMPSTASYGVVTLPNRTVSIYGPAGEGGATARLGAAAMTGVTISGTSDVTLNGMEVRDSAVGISCTGAGTLRLRRGVVAGGSLTGVTVSTCTLEIDRSQITQNLKGGVSLTSVGSYTLTNNFITKNISAGADAGVNFDNASVGTFRFNTVAGNQCTVGGGIQSGAVARELRDNIIFGNSSSGGSQLFGALTLVTTVVGAADGAAGVKIDPAFVNANGNDYKLTEVAANDNCCVDKATGTIAFDFFGAARPKGVKADIGAHEVK